MTVAIIPAATWGRRPWASAPYTVPMSERTHFFVHYDGGEPITRTGHAIPQAVDDGHHANGWAGIGYNFVVDQAGNIYEGRGWSLVGAHCPNYNRIGIGVQVAVGGAQEPSEAAKRAVVALYAEACRKAGHGLAKTYHGAYFPTACAGQRLIPWVKLGMPLSGAAPLPAAPVTITPAEPDTEQLMADLVLTNPLTKKTTTAETGLNSTWAYAVLTYGLVKALAEKADVNVDEAAIAAQVAASLSGPLKAAVAAAVTTGGSPEDIAQAVVDRLATALTGA